MKNTKRFEQGFFKKQQLIDRTVFLQKIQNQLILSHQLLGNEIIHFHCLLIV